MADEDEDDSQKTEDPSQKRLDDALKKGQVASSREVTSFLMLFVFAIILVWQMPSMMKKTMHNLMHFIEAPHEYRLDSVSAAVISREVLTDALFVMVAPLAIIIFVIYLSGFLQHPMVFSAESIMPNLDRISVMKGFGRLFSRKNLVEFLKGIAKISMIGVVAYMAISPDLKLLMQVQSEGVMAILIVLAKLTQNMMIGICSLMALLAALDFVYQYFEHMKSLRMSKKDMKDEYKQTEGSPEIKAKLRELRRKRSSKRMMAAVPTSDVVITNPTHYAVALRYESTKTEAPVVVAKGMDLVALKIREIAKENNVPIVENPPLARALYSSVQLEQEIPLEHYNAVAEVIRYVYQLKGKLPKGKR
jgi:flagellar biosynthetic protein FlhB